MTRLTRIGTVFAILLANLVAAPPGHAQWNHRYAKLDDFGHQIYLEQHELPILSHGPVDPAPAPDGRSLTFAAQGWLWRLDLQTGEAMRLTRGAGVDSRPRWSPDGRRIAFVRDHGKDTSIVLLDVDGGAEQVIDTPAIELDPEFSSDGRSLFYTSGESGSLQLRRRDLATGAEQTLTDLHQVVRNARRLPGGSDLVYLHGSGPHRVLRERNFETGEDGIAQAQTLTYHLTADTHPSQRLIVYSAPIGNDYHLWTMDLDDPRVQHRLTEGHPYALTPAFSAGGDAIYYVELDARRQFRIMRVGTYGGTPEAVEVKRWHHGEATGALALSLRDGDGGAVTARVSITRADGHPVAFAGDATYLDSQTGRHYFYVEGEATFDLPVGRYTVRAARGPLAPVATSEAVVRADATATAALAIAPIWDARAEGYVSADHHVHLNGDGHHRATHGDALRLMAGEGLDHLAPMSWNRWERRIDSAILGQRTVRDGRAVLQAQEVRSHFHGHVGVLGATTPFAPWFFGPTNPTLGDPDLTNGDVFAFADRHGAFAVYVHPIDADDDPFSRLQDNPIPLELVSDSVLEERVGLELVCAWTSPLGNAHVWYRLLNVGRPVAAMSGTDGWVDFHRTPAMGTARTYVRTGGDDSTEAVVRAAAEGRSFVTTGPALVFQVDGVRPGGTTLPGRRTWQAMLASTNDIDTLEIVVNGAIVQRMGGVSSGETRTYRGEVDLPEGGWIAARAYASERQADPWPTMHARPFAHSSPIWIGAIGSTDPAARAAAASDLIRAIDAAEKAAREAYGEVETPRLQARFDAARARLAEMMPSGASKD